MSRDPATQAPSAANASLAQGPDRRLPANTSSPETGISATSGPLLITVPEVASLCRVSHRTVWRLMADPKVGFPKPRRLRGRTLFVRTELLAFLDLGSSG